MIIWHVHVTTAVVPVALNVDLAVLGLAQLPVLAVGDLAVDAKALALADAIQVALVVPVVALVDALAVALAAEAVVP